MTALVLVVQSLTYEWGAGGRTAALAARRRDLPRDYPVPGPVPAGTVAVTHAVRWTDEDAFTSAHEDVQFFDHFVTTPADAVSVTGNSDLATLAAHSDTGIATPPLPLRPGQTARFEWNEALPGSPDRVRHSIVNVALWTWPWPPLLFTRLPDLYRSHMIRLHARLSR